MPVADAMARMDRPDSRSEHTASMRSSRGSRSRELPNSEMQYSSHVG